MAPMGRDQEKRLKGILEKEVVVGENTTINDIDETEFKEGYKGIIEFNKKKWESEIKSAEKERDLLTEVLQKEKYHQFILSDIVHEIID